MLFRFAPPAILLATVAVVAFAPSAIAQDTSPYESCLEKADADPAMLACAKDELARNEARISAAEAKLGARVPAARRAAVAPLLKAAGDAWRAYRDAQCAWEKATAAGVDAGFAEADCRASLSAARADELETRLEPPPEPEKQ